MARYRKKPVEIEAVGIGENARRAPAPADEAGKLPWLTEQEDRELHRLIDGLPWEALRAISTIKSHAYVLYHDGMNGDHKVSDLASCVAEQALELARALARALPPQPAGDVQLKPGWLKRDIERASAKVAEWEAKAQPTGDNLLLDRTAVRSIICQIQNGDLAAQVLKQIDALPIIGGAQLADNNPVQVAEPHASKAPVARTDSVEAGRTGGAHPPTGATGDNKELVARLRNPWLAYDGGVAKGPIPDWCHGLLQAAADALERADSGLATQMQEHLAAHRISVDTIKLIEHKLEAAEALVAELAKPIGWQDIRLVAGEGRLGPKTVYRAVNGILKQRARAALTRPTKEEGERSNYWTCGVCGDADVPEKFRVFGLCYRCAAQRSTEKRDRKISTLKSESVSDWNAAIEAAAKICDQEPELPGEPTSEEVEAIRADGIDSLRATVRATKKSIASAIRSLSRPQDQGRKG